MQIISINQENETPDKTTTDNTCIDTPFIQTSDRKRGRPQKGREKTKNNTRHFVCIYLSYPCKRDVDRLKNIAKAINKQNELRFQRYIKIANSPSEVLTMMQAEADERRKIEARYRVYLRQKARADKENQGKEFRATVKALARAIKNRKKIFDFN